MKATEEKSELLSAIRTIKHAQLLTLTFIDESGVLEYEDDLKTYFDSPFGSQESQQMEYAFVNAVERSIMLSHSIPESKKKEVALSHGRATLQLLRYGKLQYQYSTEKITARKYDELTKKNDVAQRASMVGQVKKHIIRQGGKMAVSTGMGYLAHAAATAGAIAIGAGLAAPVAIGLATFGVLTWGGKLIPKKVKEPIKEEWDRVQKKVLDTTVEVVRVLKDIKEEIVETVEPVINKARDVFYSIGKAAKETAGKVWEKTKAVGKRVMSWFGF